MVEAFARASGFSNAQMGEYIQRIAASTSKMAEEGLLLDPKQAMRSGFALQTTRGLSGFQGQKSYESIQDMLIAISKGGGSPLMQYHAYKQAKGDTFWEKQQYIQEQSGNDVYQDNVLSSFRKQTGGSSGWQASELAKILNISIALARKLNATPDNAAEVAAWDGLGSGVTEGRASPHLGIARATAREAIKMNNMGSSKAAIDLYTDLEAAKRAVGGWAQSATLGILKLTKWVARNTPLPPGVPDIFKQLEDEKNRPAKVKTPGHGSMQYGPGGGQGLEIRLSPAAEAFFEVFDMVTG
tara:strand:- start:1357 stop:2250 length:894 start_codon:yes stop_codon:yes gene_type:complete